MKRLLTICYIILLLAWGLPPLYTFFLTHEKSADESVRVITASGEVTMELDDYIFGVVAAEMPAYFEDEALKAQAVAARSYCEYCLNVGKHSGALCTSSGCCQAYADENALKLRWGRDYPVYAAKINKAVLDTKGERLRYEGKAVQAVFHSCSYLRTENSGDVWGSVPYLVSVSSPETSDTVKNLISTVTVSPEELKNIISSVRPEAEFSADAAQWIEKNEKNAAGRTSAVTVGGVRLSGREMRSLFLLRSADFDIEYNGENFVFTVCGFGHGVGMSQYGAELMAKAGCLYTQILEHYYPGTEIRCKV